MAQIRRLDLLPPPQQDPYASPFVAQKADATTLYGMVSKPLPLLFLALFLICIAEDGAIQREENKGIYRIAIWPIFFEIISAFGTVGLSYGKRWREETGCGGGGGGGGV